MPKKFYILILVFSILWFNIFVPSSNAQMVNMNNAAADDHTAKEEAEGKAVWEKLQAKELTCKDLSDENFGTLVEYFMGQMTGTSHEAMNNMMIQMMGEEGEEAMHIVLGKRLSGCDTAVVFPAGGRGFIPMMNMMGGGWPFGNAQDMSSPFGHGSGAFGWTFMLFWWILFVVGIVVLIRWLSELGKGKHGEEVSALEILKQRYAKGEVDRKEFEEKLRDLNKI